MKHPHVAKALKYAEEVVAGIVPANRLVRRACKRHLDDLKRCANKSYAYKFSNAAAEKVCNFAEMLPHVKGEWAKRQELVVLEPWQCFILCCLFGWLKKKNGRRRFREAYLEIPRKNGKSMLAAIIGLYMWCMDGEVGAEVYSGATTEKQAWEVFRPAKWMLERNEELLEYVGEDAVWAKALVTSGDQSRFEPVIGKPGDGSSPSCAIADEYHEHDTPDLVDTMQTGMLARTQPILLMVTTAGYNLAGPCYDKHLEMTRMLDGAAADPAANDEVFAIIYGIDELPYTWDGVEVVADEWSDPAILRKANPNFGVSVDSDILESMQRQAVLNPIDQNKFKTKHLNVWCSARVAWMPLHQWHVCADPQLKIEAFAGQDMIGVLDLASKDDLAVFAQIFKRRIKEVIHYYIFARYYLPEDTVNSIGPNTAAYRKWQKQGLLTVTDGAEIDFDRIAEDVKAYRAKYRMTELAYDPWRATQLAHQLQKEGAEVVELRQTVQNLSAPMKEVLSAVKGARLHHDGNPVTTWMIANVTAKLDAKDNIYPRKEKPQMKIDGAVAIIMGMARAMLGNDGGSMDDWLKAPVAA